MHRFGECDGKTEEQLKRLKSQTQIPQMCFGDDEYVECKEEHGECMGRELSEVVYELEGK